MPFEGAAEAAPEKKPSGYGLPCAHCHAYYPADMNACPICKSTERVSPIPSVIHSTDLAREASGPRTGAPLDEERERLLKELKSQAFAAHLQINTSAAFQCTLKDQHSETTEPAAICHSCYNQIRQKADLMEAALLHIDAKDAAKIVYEAVWADTSDPNATYLNAARALLAEMRMRAGLGLHAASDQVGH